MNPKRTRGGEKGVKLTDIETAIIALATYLEDVHHDQYKVREHILGILGLEFAPQSKLKVKL